MRYRQKTGVHFSRGSSSARCVTHRGAEGGSGEGGGGCGEGAGGGGGEGGRGEGAGPGGSGEGDGAGEGGGGGGGGGGGFDGGRQNLHERHLHLGQWCFLKATSHHASHVGFSHL